MFFHLLRAGFAQPRKQIHNVFTEELGLEPAQLRRVLDEAGIDPAARAQHLDLADWERLFRAFQSLYPEAIEMDGLSADAPGDVVDLAAWDADAGDDDTEEYDEDEADEDGEDDPRDD